MIRFPKNIRTVCVISLLHCAGVTMAQPGDELVVRPSLVTGRAAFVTPQAGTTISMTQNIGQPAALRFLEAYGDLFGIEDVDAELKPVSTTTDALGHTRSTYKQIYQGIEVFSGSIHVHQNAHGQIIAANGDFYPIAIKNAPLPRLRPDEAFQRSIAELNHHAAAIEKRNLVLVDPGWYGDPPRGVHLAYHIILNNQLAPMLPTAGDGPIREAFFIDAQNGAVLDRWSLVYDAKDRSVHDALVGSDCCYRHDGTGCDDTACQEIVCDRYPLCCDQGWTNICGARAAQHCPNLCLPGPVARQEGEPPTGNAGVDAMYDYYGDTYDYFFRTFGRDSYDDQGATIVGTLNSPAIGCPNAAWFGGIGQMLFCDGTTSDDIVAHEYMHALTEATADLIYQNQPGQLNESFSDIFGEVVDLLNGNVLDIGPAGGTPWPVHLSGPGFDEPNLERSTCSDPSAGYSNGVRWLIGEDAIGFGDAIRDMWDPTCLGDPDRANSPLQTCSIIDSGGVHSGSGIPNHAFALVSDGGSFNGFDIEGIGIIKAAAIWYRALTTYLSIASDFDETYAALNQSALDLFGVDLTDPRTGQNFSSPITLHDATQLDLALQAVEMNTPGRCGASVDVLNADSPPLCAEAVIIFEDDLEGDLSEWTVSNESPSGPPTPYDWIPTEQPLPFQRPGVAWFCADPGLGDCNLQNESAIHSLFSPAIAIPSDATFPYLAFTHYMESEAGWDGGTISIRVNGGDWTRVLRRHFEFNAYNSALRFGSALNLNPLQGENAWTGIGGRWGTSVVDLRALVQPGDQLELRFDFGKDGCSGVRGWYVDDVIVYHCPDCNLNNKPDHRDMRFSVSTESVGNIGFNRPQTFVFEKLPWPTSDVEMVVRAQADLSAENEWLDLHINGRFLQRVFVAGANDCAGASDIARITVPRDLFREVATAFETQVEITASERVSPTLCSQTSFISLDLSYEVSHIDADANGIPDECENCVAPQPAAAHSNPIEKSRYISFHPMNAGRHTALQVILTNAPDSWVHLEGMQMWAAMPRRVSTKPGSDRGTEPSIVTAQPSCTPAYFDWGAQGSVHLYGEWIIPDATYEIRMIDLACDRDEPRFWSEPLAISTGLWGDLAGPCGSSICAIPDGVVDITDVSSYLASFRGDAGAPSKTQADIAGAAVNNLVDIQDLLHACDAFAGHPFPYAPLAPCIP